MGKYDVTFSCGHETTVTLFGKIKEREKRIEWYKEHGLCPDCYSKQRAEQLNNKMARRSDKIEMSYKEYKAKYDRCKTVPDSYNKETKTVVVYVDRRIKMKEELMELFAELVGGTHISAQAAFVSYFDQGVYRRKLEPSYDRYEILQRIQEKAIPYAELFDDDEVISTF